MSFEITPDDELMEGIHETLNAEATKAARVLRDKFVIPFCDHYNVRVLFGNGGLVFIRLDDERTLYTYDQDLPADLCRNLDRLNEILCDGPLGARHGWDSYMEDYTPCSDSN